MPAAEDKEDERLLGGSDLAPVEVMNGDSAFPAVLLCEHAGRAVPKALGTLGISSESLMSHRGWDIGAESVARGISERLGAPLVIQRYSRLVIDANRPPQSRQAIPVESDRVRIPGNAGIAPEDRARRVAEIFHPMNAAIDAMFEIRERRACYSIHSFTPELGERVRPWHAGFLSRRDLATANALRNAVLARRPELTLAVNEPYQIDDETDWFIPVHAERRGLTHTLIEIRNDQIAGPEGAATWAMLLADAIARTLEAAG